MLPQTIDKLPVVTLLHGDNDHAIGQSLQKILSLLGDPGMAELNLTRLDGSQASLEDVRSVLFTMPFLAEKRMLVLTHPLARITDTSRELFISILNGLPATAALVLIVEDTFDRKDWKTLHGKHWLRIWIQSSKENALYLPCQLPTGDQMTGWIMNFARSLNGQFEPRAASELAASIGNDTRLAANEIEKLLTYVNFKRPVGVDDVILLTTATNTGNIFELIDAVAQQDSRKALHLLHHQLEQQEPGALFFLVVRQFRLLIQAREIMDDGGTVEQIEREYKLHPYVAKKLYGQASRFTMSHLVDIYHRLFEIDEAVKTGQNTMEMSLDVFIASFELN